jgi:hypothetical protein
MCYLFNYLMSFGVLSHVSNQLGAEMKIQKVWKRRKIPASQPESGDEVIRDDCQDIISCLLGI